MRLSKLARIYEFGGKDKFYYVLRHALLNTSFLLNEKEYENLISHFKSEVENDVILKLKKAHILVGDGYKEKKFVEFLKNKYKSNKFDLEIIYLIFNSKCNFDCKYCYVEKSASLNFRHQLMSENIFNKMIVTLEKMVVDMKKKCPRKKKLKFIFYGSEPLISKNLIKRSLEKITKICNKYEIVPEFDITTNGVLFDDGILDYFKKFNVKVSVSLDGSKIINDKMRITASGDGTYDLIIDGLNKLNNKNVPFGISCTIGPHNVDDLEESVKLFKSLGAVSVGFNILLGAGHYGIPQISLNKLNNSLISASSFALSQNIYEDRVQRKIKSFNQLFLRLKDCGGVGNQLVFFPNGDIGVCEAYLCNRKYIVSSVDNFSFDDLVDNEIIKLWTERYPLNMEDCVYCPAIGICGGGCPFNAEIRMGNLNKLDKPFCVHTNKILEWLLNKSVSDKIGETDLFMRDISFMFWDRSF